MIGKYIWHKAKHTVAEGWPYIVAMMAALGILIMMGGGLFQERIATLIGVLLLLPGIYLMVYLSCYIVLRDWIIEMQEDYQKFKQSQSKDGDSE